LEKVIALMLCTFGIFCVFFVFLQVDYFVDCYYSSTERRLWLIGGTSSGTLGYFPITQKCKSPAIGAVEAILESGHTGVVRSILPATADQTSRCENACCYFETSVWLLPETYGYIPIVK
jgi:hypothetical protein